MSSQPINSGSFKSLNLEVNHLKSSTNINQSVKTLYGETKKSDELNLILNFTKNIVSLASEHSKKTI